MGGECGQEYRCATHITKVYVETINNTIFAVNCSLHYILSTYWYFGRLTFGAAIVSLFSFVVMATLAAWPMNR